MRFDSIVITACRHATHGLVGSTTERGSNIKRHLHEGKLSSVLREIKPILSVSNAFTNQIMIIQKQEQGVFMSNAPEHTIGKNFQAGQQQRASTELSKQFDYIICGSGSSGSVVAGRLAANPDIQVLLLEAGGSDETDMVLDTDRWPMNLGGELDWSFLAESNPRLNGRSILYSMGKVLGGGSSINVGTWSRGHEADWEFYAAESGDQSWGYEAIRGLYRSRVEDWTGVPDPDFYGVGGAMHVQPIEEPDSFSLAMLDAAESMGLKRFSNSGGQMMRADGGCAVVDNIIHDGKRQSAYRSYVHPLLQQPNLTVLTGALTTRILFEGSRATGVEFEHQGQLHQAEATFEIVLSQGAIQTPKLLMQSGIGDEAELGKFGIPVLKHLPGVGRNMHDHVALALVWEATDLPLPQIARSTTVAFWKTNPALDAPNFYTYGIGLPFLTPENAANFPPPSAAWTFFMGMRPASRGSVHLTGANASDPVKVDANYLSDPQDLEDLKLGVLRAREIGNAAALHPYTKRQHAPANLTGTELEEYIRNGLTTFWHQSGTAKMGRNAMSVVDSELRVYGIDGLRVADASVLPRVTTGNTMAPCVIIGERAAELLLKEHRTETRATEELSLQSTK
jgi:choline dehydrogenase